MRNVPWPSVSTLRRTSPTTAASMANSSYPIGSNLVDLHAEEDIACVFDFMIHIYVNICEERRKERMVTEIFNLAWPAVHWQGSLAFISLCS